jgi:TetR/AcrR family transcriptional repressor of nem operon
MRYSKDHKRETHERIVRKASVKLRERGAHGIGVADLMKEAGLTHGGFYAHFPSREALVVEAFAYAMDRAAARWQRQAEDTPADKRFAAIIESYLSPAHRDNPGTGCAVPALAAEIAREGSKTRKVFGEKLERMIDRLAEQLPGRSRKAAREQALASLATMVGALILARAGGGELSDEILTASRRALLSGPESETTEVRKRSGRAGKPSARH